jgi:sterol desaturase/sphingolipid hydroxylase (fatty acid hydroxylase superfamily)
MNFVRYYPIAGIAFLIFYLWKKDYFARFKIQAKYPAAEKIWTEIRQSAITLIMFSGIGITVYSLIRLGVLKSYMYKDPTMYGGVPYMILSFILITIWHETYFYWAHRLMHHKKIYKYVHLVHHQSVNPTPVAAYNFHYIEAFFEAIYAVIFTLTVSIYYLVFIFHTF